MNAEANTESLLQVQDAHTGLLNDIRLNQLRINAIGDDADAHQPLWLVPIGRNPDFVGRKSIIAELGKRLEPVPDSVGKAVLCGLGGVG